MTVRFTFETVATWAIVGFIAGCIVGTNLIAVIR